MIDLRYWIHRALDRKVRLKVLERDNFTCRNCGKKPDKLEVHHIVPLISGGTHDLDNLLTVCQKCHDYLDHPVKVSPMVVIKVKPRTYQELKEMAKPGESMDRVIRRLLERSELVQI
jgi:5-methylcytosine-specific restriction endonuclease McrA